MILYFVTIFLKRTYSYLLLTFFSILVGAFLFGGVISLSRSVSTFFIKEGKTLIGGDVVITGAAKIDTGDNRIQALKQRGYTFSEEYSFQSVFKNTVSTTTTPAQVRVVGDEFPLYGQVVVTPTPFELLPGNHRLYGEQLFLDRLGVRVGDKVSLGTTTFTVAGVLVEQPDAISLGVSISPNVIMHVTDFSDSGIDLTESRTTYKLLIKENLQNLFTASDIQTLKSFAKEKKLRFDDSTDGPNSYVRGLSSVMQFLGIVLAIALFLVVVNIVANLAYLITRFRKTIALLKTFGATTLEVQSIYTIVLGGIGLLGGSIGALLGGIASNMLLPFVSSYLSKEIAGTSLISITIFGGVIGFLIIIAASLPFFHSLRFVLPKQLLSNAKSSQTEGLFMRVLFYLPIPILIAAFLYTLTSNIPLVLYSVSGVIAVFLLCVAISYGILQVLYKQRYLFSLGVRTTISSLVWRGVETFVITASITTAFLGVFIVSTLERNIIENINQNVSNSAPSLYLIDITKSQLPAVVAIAGETFKEYPIIRGRLLSVNNRDLTASNNPGVTREFNITYRSSLIEQEKVIAGEWHGDSTTNAVSIDSKFAEEIGGVSVGDTIKVFVQGLTIEARVTSIRETDQSSGIPFFYLVFSPDVLQKFPATYFGTVYANQDNILAIEQALGGVYPNIIPIRTGEILNKVSELVATLIFVVQVIGIPSIILGLMLIIVMTGQSLYERRGDILILRALGMGTRTIVRLFITEVVSIVLVASAISYLIAHILAYILNKFLFSFDTFVFATSPLYITAGVSVIVSIFAYVISVVLTRTPLKKLLAEK